MGASTSRATRPAAARTDANNLRGIQGFMRAALSVYYRNAAAVQQHFADAPVRRLFCLKSRQNIAIPVRTDAPEKHLGITSDLNFASSGLGSGGIRRSGISGGVLDLRQRVREQTLSDPAALQRLGKPASGLLIKVGLSRRSPSLSSESVRYRASPLSPVLSANVSATERSGIGTAGVVLLVPDPGCLQSQDRGLRGA